ncbi:50S ribosomal protein L25/general stress protein Ctc [Kurthia senegalensis]|uniref:50S ribosomal protein L25/general stress protein Ctc n=1 Tax=Kurthia senegalensis TaxID=1033740 RepID=UPI000287F9D1|nr:50S ribosomal protein L25/general stress protein Ctc [Kurthia senegalensis]
MGTSVTAKVREAHKRSIKTELRKSGYVPAVVYGFKTDSTPIAVDAKQLEKTIRIEGRNAIITLDVEGKNVNAVLKEVQKDPVQGKLVHLDFLAVSMRQELEVEVPVVTVGVSPGVKEGGVLQQPIREIKVSAKPNDLPESVEVDISALAIGDTLTVGEVRDKSKYTILNEDEDVLVTVSAPVSEAELEADLEATEPVADNGTVEDEDKAE